MNDKPHILFAGSIRGGRQDQPIYKLLIESLQTSCEVLNPHVGDDDVSDYGETDVTKREIFEREMERLSRADALIAEVTTPSLGVGYLIAAARQKKIPVLCFYRGKDTFKLSAMIKGDEGVDVWVYTDLHEAIAYLQTWLQKL